MTLQEKIKELREFDNKPTHYPASEIPKLLDCIEIQAEALEKIEKRPDLPNPDKDADWKNCMKWSAHDAREAQSKVNALFSYEEDLIVEEEPIMTEELDHEDVF